MAQRKFGCDSEPTNSEVKRRKTLRVTNIIAVSNLQAQAEKM